MSKVLSKDNMIEIKKIILQAYSGFKKMNDKLSITNICYRHADEFDAKQELYSNVL